MSVRLEIQSYQSQNVRPYVLCSAGQLARSGLLVVGIVVLSMGYSTPLGTSTGKGSHLDSIPDGHVACGNPYPGCWALACSDSASTTNAR